MKQLLFIQTGTGTDIHGQNITKASVRAVEDAIHSNSMPGIEGIPSENSTEMDVHVKLAVPLDRQQVQTKEIEEVIPYGTVNVEVTEGGMATSNGIILEEDHDKNDLMYIVNAAVEVRH
ncbi:Lin0512 family protein [Gracilibacillus sp. YIM 98692]|uniref:Lin0512 family protein n=1 Tax=Gracilibacillus sp. YIM 98692 TaxID=2663532 RepID=UPI0013D672DB|nr:Lin0512 family protein [Gracilibacillus sp. YIM 98692]